MSENVQLKIYNHNGVSLILDLLEGMPEDSQTIADLLFVALSAAYMKGFEDVSIFSLMSQQMQVIKDKLDAQ